MIMTAEELRALGVTAASPEMLLEVAAEIIAEYLGRDIFVEEREAMYAGAREICLKAYPVREVRSVTAAEDDPSAERKPVPYSLNAESGILTLKGEIPERVTVVYTGGMAEHACDGSVRVPMPVRYAAAMLVKALAKQMESGGQTVMSERLSDYQVMYYNSAAAKGGGLTALSPAAAALLAPYRSRWL